MDDVVTKITKTEKDINTGKTSVKMNDVKPPAFKAPSKTPTTSSSGWDTMTILKIFLIIVILAMLGFNLFAYLAKGTDVFSNFMASYGKYIPEGLKRILNLSEKGTELGLDVAAGTVKDVKKVIQKTSGAQSKLWKARDKNLEKSINAGNFRGLNNHPGHIPDQTNSRVQEKNKKGWCYIGTDKGYRSCVEIGKDDMCMSGKVYNREDICKHPELRE